MVADGADFALESSFDAVFSNAALHWIHPPTAAVKCIYKALTKRTFCSGIWWQR
ncbi:MAG: methyltransferase domain-containing protein [Pleurocapsa sp. MO_226.B13]|nr:methyltransferase domain-containing protein [Pleurocapsa sp. MO_226.B13]